jgi:hypothetical protein
LETRGVYHRAQLHPESRDQNWAARNPLQRVGEYRELANLARFLVSDSAGHINGEMVVRDGGAHLRSSGPEALLAWTDARRSNRWRARKTGREGRTEGEAGPDAAFGVIVTAFPIRLFPAIHRL